MGKPEPCRFHAHRCHDLCIENGIADFDLAYAHEALARAYAAGGDFTQAAQHFAQAQACAVGIADADDRAQLAEDLRSGPWFGFAG